MALVFGGIALAAHSEHIGYVLENRSARLLATAVALVALVLIALGARRCWSLITARRAGLDAVSVTLLAASAYGAVAAGAKLFGLLFSINKL